MPTTTSAKTTNAAIIAGRLDVTLLRSDVFWGALKLRAVRAWDAERLGAACEPETLLRCAEMLACCEDADARVAFFAVGRPFGTDICLAEGLFFPVCTEPRWRLEGFRLGSGVRFVGCFFGLSFIYALPLLASFSFRIA